MPEDMTPSQSNTEAREDVHEPAPDAGPERPPVDEVADAVAQRFGGVAHLSHGQAVVHVARERWRDVAMYLHDEERFTQCMDVTAVDHLTDATRALPDGVAGERFEVVANYLSHPRNRRVRVIAQVRVDEPEIASIVDVYPGVDFAEREVYDLMGITFTDHPELARIQMPDDWIGHPLRKDDPPANVPVTFKEDPTPR